MGRRWELVVRDDLRSVGHTAEKQTTKAPFDVLVDGVVRVNVKSAHHRSYTMANGGKCTGFFFGLSTSWQRCDVFALIRDEEQDTRPPTLWVPAKRLQQQTLTLTKRHWANEWTDYERAREEALR